MWWKALFQFPLYSTIPSNTIEDPVTAKKYAHCPNMHVSPLTTGCVDLSFKELSPLPKPLPFERTDKSQRDGN